MNKNNKIYHIKGKIASINPAYTAVFTIQAINNESEIIGKLKCITKRDKCGDYEPIIGAIIDGSVIETKHVKHGKQYEFISKPQIVINVELDELSFVNNVVSGINYDPGKKKNNKNQHISDIDNMKLRKLYNKILFDENPFTFMQKLVAFKEYENKLTEYIKDVDINIDIYKVSIWWLDFESKKYLNSLGVSVKKLNKLGYSKFKDFLGKLYIYPFSCYHLSVSMCEEICKLFHITYTKYDMIAGNIARKINLVLKEKLWTKLPDKMLDQSIKKNSNLAEIEKILLSKHNIDKVTDIDTFYFFKHIDKKEKFLAEWLVSKSITKNNCYIKIKLSNHLNDEQKKAIKGALSNTCSIITGGAGTGKSTVICEIVRNLISNEIKYACVSFTGKAVSRLKEIFDENGIDKTYIQTIHRLIYRKNKKNEDTEESNNIINPIYVIIDECSMVTGDLMYSLLSKYTSIEALILVGDHHQLEPFGKWGRPFLSLIETKIAKIYELKYNHRSNSKKGIASNAQLIRNLGPNEVVNILHTEDFEYFPGDIKETLEIYQWMLNSGVKREKIKIICPLNKISHEINKSCQRIWKEQLKMEPITGTFLCVGDLVIMTKNDYKKNVMNGEEGMIIHFDSEKEEVTVRFGQNKNTRIIVFSLKSDVESNNTTENGNDEDEEIVVATSLKLAYCLTVHKSQGSEYDYVIFLCSKSYINNRNLVYTAITRAKLGIFCFDKYEEMKLSTMVLPKGRYDSLIKYISAYKN